MKLLPTPRTDLADFTDQLSQAWGVGWGFPAAQYVAWSEGAGIFSTLSARMQLSVDELFNVTALSEKGMDALLPILMALKLVTQESGRYRLTALGSEYFVSDSPYYVGPGLFRNHDLPIPPAHVKSGEVLEAPRALTAGDIKRYFQSQLSRNLAAGVQAIRSGRFDHIDHLVDIGGGAGSFAIPFAQDHPHKKVSLVDLPQHMDAIANMLASYDLTERIHLIPMDVFGNPWEFGDLNGILFGNFFHVFNDAACRELLMRCFNTLPSGGVVFVHELPFDEDRAGPMVAALWNANMRMIGGRQRTCTELFTLLRDAGFKQCKSNHTASRFQLFEGTKI